MKLGGTFAWLKFAALLPILGLSTGITRISGQSRKGYAHIVAILIVIIIILLLLILLGAI